MWFVISLHKEVSATFLHPVIPLGWVNRDLFFQGLHQQFHFLRANALRVGFPLGFFMGPFTPLIRAQKDLRRLAALLPFFNFDGGVVTAVFSLLPGLAARYLLTPLAVRPPDADLSPLLTENFFGIVPLDFFLTVGMMQI